MYLKVKDVRFPCFQPRNKQKGITTASWSLRSNAWSQSVRFIEVLTCAPFELIHLLFLKGLSELGGRQQELVQRAKRMLLKVQLRYEFFYLFVFGRMRPHSFPSIVNTYRMLESPFQSIQFALTSLVQRSLRHVWGKGSFSVNQMKTDAADVRFQSNDKLRNIRLCVSGPTFRTSSSRFKCESSRPLIIVLRYWSYCNCRFNKLLSHRIKQNDAYYCEEDQCSAKAKRPSCKYYNTCLWTLVQSTIRPIRSCGVDQSRVSDR